MKLLQQLYKISSKSGVEDQMKEFIFDYLRDVDLDIETDDIGNVFITKGLATSYPCVAAHLDEIHSPCQRETVIDGDIIYTIIY